MKATTQTTKRFPDSFRMIFYVAAVAALGLLNCCVLRTGVLENNTDYSSSLEAAVKIQAEPDLRLEDWMLDPGNYVAETLYIADNGR